MTEQEYKERCDFLNDMMEEARYRKPPLNYDMWKTVMQYGHEERDKAYVEFRDSNQK
jgi:hypothetical protein